MRFAQKTAQIHKKIHHREKNLRQSGPEFSGFVSEFYPWELMWISLWICKHSKKRGYAVQFRRASVKGQILLKRRHTMTAQAKLNTIQVAEIKKGFEASIHDGEATALFTSGSAPAGADALLGDATEMFTSGSAPVTSEAFSGEATGLFTSGSAPSTASRALIGDAVEMFTSGSAPVTSDASTGDAVEMFTSGSAPVTSDATTGDAVEMFTSGSAPVTSDATTGDAVEMFTSGSAPVTSDATTGDAVEMFT
ncbi:hypothetical protein, partial [Primorskyibacter sedentarius]|uniref:hypothetical protein n=1 Tax=Primorskyibacter sedentarius TaxID=745311 RepID=UPI003EB95969